VIIAILISVFSTSIGPSSDIGRLWLIVGASESKPAQIAAKASALSGSHSDGLVFNTRDCGDKAAVFGWAAEITTSSTAAEAALARVQTTIKDAYIKRCDVKPRTLLAFKLNAVDPSIANVPANAVNWDDDDRVSSVIPLADGWTLVVGRYFVPDPKDPLEGRRERLVLVDAAGKQIPLVDECLMAGGASLRKQRFAVHCVIEQAADQLLHNVLVFDIAGKQITEIQRCRNPRWTGDLEISCLAESFEGAGELKLRTKRFALSAIAK
jgi:hypothetical protein